VIVLTILGAGSLSRKNDSNFFYQSIIVSRVNFLTSLTDSKIEIIKILVCLKVIRNLLTDKSWTAQQDGTISICL
jgi:hypothetical protein